MIKLGNGMGLVYKKKGNSGRILIRKVKVKRKVDIEDRKRKVKDGRKVRLKEKEMNIDIMIVGNIEEDLLKNILESEKKMKVKILVKENGNMRIEKKERIEMIMKGGSIG